MQLKALNFVQDNSAQLSAQAYPSVLARFERLGWNHVTLKLVLRYIRNQAPIIIHVNLDKALHFLVKDTHYRNQFETNTSGGTLCHSTRRAWENRMFSGIYDSSSAFDRVKYGVLNIFNDPNGVDCCHYYGDSYMLLRDVRLRSTFASKDSSNSDVVLSSGTSKSERPRDMECLVVSRTKILCARTTAVEHYTHVLKDFSDTELQQLVALATGKKQCLNSNTIQHYKEMQIHGEVDLSRHVEALVVNFRHKNNADMMAMAERFCARNRCQLIMMEPKTT